MAIIIALFVIMIIANIISKTQWFNEMQLALELQKNIDREDIFKGLTMNTIREKAAHLVFAGRISFEFYEKMFLGNYSNEGPHLPWWEYHKDNIKNYSIFKRA